MKNSKNNKKSNIGFQLTKFGDQLAIIINSLLITKFILLFFFNFSLLNFTIE